MEHGTRVVLILGGQPDVPGVYIPGRVIPYIVKKTALCSRNTLFQEFCVPGARCSLGSVFLELYFPGAGFAV